MTGKAKSFGAMLLIIGSLASHAEPPSSFNAATFVKSCVHQTQTCNAYINGFMDGVMLDQIHREQGTPICIPGGTTTDQLRKIIISFILTHEKLLSFPGNSVVGEALFEVFPCKN